MKTSLRFIMGISSNLLLVFTLSAYIYTTITLFIENNKKKCGSDNTLIANLVLAVVLCSMTLVYWYSNAIDRINHMFWINIGYMLFYFLLFLLLLGFLYTTLSLFIKSNKNDINHQKFILILNLVCAIILFLYCVFHIYDKFMDNYYELSDLNGWVFDLSPCQSCPSKFSNTKLKNKKYKKKKKV